MQLKIRRNLFLHPTFKEGLFEIQDANSQRIAPALQLKAGLTVIDACAGGGGKTLQMAALMENKGKIIALDTEAWKLANLKQRARRAGVFNIETRHIENNKVIKRLHNHADQTPFGCAVQRIGRVATQSRRKMETQSQPFGRSAASSTRYFEPVRADV